MTLPTLADLKILGKEARYTDDDHVGFIVHEICHEVTLGLPSLGYSKLGSISARIESWIEGVLDWEEQERNERATLAAQVLVLERLGHPDPWDCVLVASETGIGNNNEKRYYSWVVRRTNGSAARRDAEEVLRRLRALCRERARTRRKR